MTTQSDYSFRGFVYSAKDDDTQAWSARLCCGVRRVARVAATDDGQIQVDFAGTRDRRDFEAFLATSFPGEAIEDAGAEFLARLADETYHRRRLQVVSLRHTVFRLAGDPPMSYRYLQGMPPSADVLGKLRLTYGQRLLEVLRADTLATHAA
jgi:hypothetical protein